MRFIFDLDGTVIDSTHRQASHPDGTLDLEHWVENSTPALIERDTLLPLADVMRAAIMRGDDVIICTARVLAEADLDFLERRGLYVPDILSRPEGCNWPDPVLKSLLLKMYCQDNCLNWQLFLKTAIMFEDAKPTIELLRGKGLTVYDAVEWNGLVRTANLKTA